VSPQSKFMCATLQQHLCHRDVIASNCCMQRRLPKLSFPPASISAPIWSNTLTATSFLEKTAECSEVPPYAMLTPISGKIFVANSYALDVSNSVEWLSSVTIDSTCFRCIASLNNPLSNPLCRLRGGSRSSNSCNTWACPELKLNVSANFVAF
jgi:hypothetical protein